jgi:coproporphyrinogen III oxidase-like Fe-S oxidoreductase
MDLQPLLTYLLRRGFARRLRFEPCDGAPCPPPIPDPGTLLYLHIPFCEHLCPFCSFHRVRFEPDKARRYFHALRQEIRTLHGQGLNCNEVYVGGGTPTVMPEELAATLQLLRELFPIRRLSVETNPNHLREEVLTLLAQQGVNRLSVGIQSFDDALLKRMERYHAYGSGALNKERLLAAQGRIETLNVDMIFNLPHQSPASLEEDLRILVEDLGVDQVSYYPLMSAASTRRRMAQSMGAIGFERERDYYRTILARLRPVYTPTSGWCFSRRPGMIDEYIVDRGEFAAAGSGSFSCLDGTVYSNTFSINRYMALAEQGCSPAVARKRLTRRERLRYALLMGLFGLRLSKRRLRESFGPRVLRELRGELLLLRALGAIREDKEQIRLTEQGMYYSVVAMRELFIGVNNFRDQMRLHIRSEPPVRDCSPVSATRAAAVAYDAFRADPPAD